MATNAAQILEIDFCDIDPDIGKRMDAYSDDITASYSSTAAVDYDDYDYWDEFDALWQPYQTDYGLTATERQYAHDQRNLKAYYAGCALVVAALFCFYMLAMINGLTIQKNLQQYNTTVSALQEEYIRLEAELECKRDSVAVAEFAAENGLHKPLPFQVIYVGEEETGAGIISNAKGKSGSQEEIWARLKSFLD